MDALAATGVVGGVAACWGQGAPSACLYDWHVSEMETAPRGDSVSSDGERRRREKAQRRLPRLHAAPRFFRQQLALRPPLASARGCRSAAGESRDPLPAGRHNLLGGGGLGGYSVYGICEHCCDDDVSLVIWCRQDARGCATCSEIRNGVKVTAVVVLLSRRLSARKSCCFVNRQSRLKCGVGTPAFVITPTGDRWALGSCFCPMDQFGHYPSMEQVSKCSGGHFEDECK